MHRGGQQTSRRRNRHSNKVLPPRPARVARLRVVTDVEPCQPGSAADEEEKANKRARMHQVLAQLVIDALRQKMKAPDISQQAGSYAKRDHIRQRIQLLAKLARGIGHAGDSTIERVEWNRKKNGYSRPVKMRPCIVIGADRRDGLRDRKVPGGNIAHREQRRQQVHSATQPRLGIRLGDRLVAAVHQRSPLVVSGNTMALIDPAALVTAATIAPSAISARMLEPPFTFCPTLTCKIASTGKITSVLEPNLIRPTRCPRSSRSPSRGTNTMRRASRPAICLKTISIPSP